MAVRASSPQVMRQMATPTTTPPTGAYLLYFKGDGTLYKRDSTGTETTVTPSTSSPFSTTFKFSSEF